MLVTIVLGMLKSPCIKTEGDVQWKNGLQPNLQKITYSHDTGNDTTKSVPSPSLVSTFMAPRCTLIIS